jgi:hypothetical protein
MNFTGHAPMPPLTQTTPEEQEAATRLIQVLTRVKDGEDGGPWWHGWAIHYAFLLGVLYARRRSEKRSPTPG